MKEERRAWMRANKRQRIGGADVGIQSRRNGRRKSENIRPKGHRKAELMLCVRDVILPLAKLAGTGHRWHGTPRTVIRQQRCRIQDTANRCRQGRYRDQIPTKWTEKERRLAGLPEALLYVRHITAPDAFPCTVVEEHDIVAINTVNLVAACVHSIPI